MASDALLFHVDGMREDGESIPPPSSVDAIMADPQNRTVDRSCCGQSFALSCRRSARSAQAAAEIGVTRRIWL
jgi:hypothetical protein